MTTTPGEGAIAFPRFFFSFSSMNRFLPLLALLCSSVSAVADDPAAAPAPLPPEVAKLLDEAARRTPPERRVQADDAIMTAWMLARMITGDHDAMCQQQFRCIEALIERGRIEEAGRLTLDIPDYRSAMGSLRCAEALVDKPDGRVAATGYLERVQSVISTVKPWQQHALQVRMAALGALTGWDAARVEACVQNVELPIDRFGARLLVFTRRALAAGEIDLAALELLMGEQPEKDAPQPDMLEAARLLLKLAEKTPEDRLEPLFHAIGDLCARSHAYHADVLVDQAFFWFQRGNEARAKAAFAKAEPQFGFHLPGGGQLYHRMAGLWKLRGKTAEIRPYFERLETQARALLRMDRPAAFTWLAAAWRELGENARAEVVLHEALQEAAANENPRMRLIGCIEIALGEGRTGRPLSPALVKGCEAVLRGTPLKHE